jgi:hypothetical protein
MKKLIIFCIILTMIVVPISYAVSFSDVNSDGWEYKYVTELSDKGVINGYPDGTFNPTGTITRGEFLKLIITASTTNTEVENKPFDHWAAGYVLIGENYSVLDKGQINKDNIDLPITRIEMAEILGKCDIKMKETNQVMTRLEFNDIDSVTNMQYSMLAHDVEMGYINGYPDGTFMPEKTLTRAEAATIIWRYTQQ